MQSFETGGRVAGFNVLNRGHNGFVAHEHLDDRERDAGFVHGDRGEGMAEQLVIDFRGAGELRAGRGKF